MKFLQDCEPNYNLTYNDVFLVPGASRISSRFDVDITPPDKSGARLPLIVANMNAVAGKRMAETIARRGGLVILPQDIPFDVLEPMIKYIKSRHTIYETPLTLTAENTIAEALNIIHKRSHGSVFITDNQNRPLGIFTESDAGSFDRFTPLSQVMTSDLVTIAENTPPKTIYDLLNKKHVNVAPVLKNGRIMGVMSAKSALRSSLYEPALDRRGRLMVSVAIGINGDVATKAQAVLDMGADILVLDTAHGHQRKMIKALKAVRTVSGKTLIVAGNVVTAEGTRDLIKAGADIVKVGVGPGAMCTTRMMTGVGRPQFSAVAECAGAARQLGKHIWADGGIRYPRDVALALAAGASNVMFGSWWAGTYESAGDTLRDNQGNLYKENYGMASRRAVKNRTGAGGLFEQAKRELFEEGISESRYYIDPKMPGAEDIIDQIVAGLRSSMSYTGASNIDKFYDLAVIGLQSPSGYQEGRPIETNWE